MDTRMNLRESWASTERDLARACQMLPDDAGNHEAISRYREYVEHNELELACDALEQYGNEHPVPEEFWIALRDAALNMGLKDNASRFASRIAT